MLSASEKTPSRWLTRSGFARLVLLVVASLLSLVALVMPLAIRPSSYPLNPSDVAQQDITAPYALTFSSEVLTEQARLDAEQSVNPVYQPADPAIARRQIEQLRVALNYVTTVRLDQYATDEVKYVDLAAISSIAIQPELAERILLLTDSGWELVEQEAQDVLETVMRNTIREDQVESALRSIPSLVSYSLSEEQADIVAQLVRPLVTANSLYSEEQTRAAQGQARNEVIPVTRTFMAGESIVRRGQIISPLAYEALEVFGLVQPSRDYMDILSAAALVALVSSFTGLYVSRRRTPLLQSPRYLLVIGLTFLVFLFAARFVIPNRVIVPYLFPLAAFGLTVSTLFSLEISLIFSLVLSILTAFGLQNSLDLTLFYTLSSLVGIMVLGRGRHVGSYFWAGLAIGAAGSAVILAYRLSDALMDWIGVATLISAAFFNGLASASLTLLLQFIFSQLLGLTTPLQLLDLMRPDHPLLQHMLRNMPGSYQHSLQVANLAEQAAEAIGADALLVKVGAIYHDCGKTANPMFFIENQGSHHLNPHDELDPVTSASIIIRHIEDGVALAKKHRLPPSVRDFIREHHGTLMTRYQYAKALEAAGNDPGKVDVSLFRYPGPRPRSRETALLMLADGVEARARAEGPRNEDELRVIVRQVFEYCQREDQLEDTTLTFRDLYNARESFVSTLLNTYHPRIRYPEIKTTPRQPEDASPAVVSAPEDEQPNQDAGPQPASPRQETL